VFVGEFVRSIDANGRVALPATFLHSLDGECYLRRHPQGSLSVRTSTEYRAEADALRGRIRAGELPDHALDALGAATTRVAIDKQGRVTLDAEALEHAAIRPGADVTFVGNVFAFSIWRSSRYRTVKAEIADAEPARAWNDEDDD